jgi:hypothetical protein
MMWQLGGRSAMFGVGGRKASGWRDEAGLVVIAFEEVGVG